MTYLHYISVPFPISIFFFFFNDTATTEIYTLSLHDALPIYNPSTSGVSSFTLNGGSASIAYNAKSWLSGVADFGGYNNGNILNTGINGTLSTYLFGPRVSYRHFGRITPFGEVLFGVAHASSAGTSGSDNAFAMTLGGGLDYKWSDRFAIRPVKLDYLMTRFSETG